MNKNNREMRKLLKSLGIKRRDGRLWVVRQYDGKEDRTDEYISVKPFVVEPAYITYSAGATLNMGNYQSMRVDVGITLPTYIEEIPDAYKRAEDIVNAKMDEIVQGIKNDKK